MYLKLYIAPFIFVLSGCLSTSKTEPIESDMLAIKIEQPAIDNVNVPIIPTEQQIINLEKSKPQDTVNRFNQPPVLIKPRDITKLKQGLKQETKQAQNPILNRQVCRENLPVKYRVADPNGYKSVYSATVQAQAIAVEISADEQKLKLKITGWFTKNKNLQQWQPYLTEAPYHQNIILKKRYEVWDEIKHWNLCSLTKV